MQKLLSCIYFLGMAISLQAQIAGKEWPFYSNQKFLEWNRLHPYLLDFDFKTFNEATLAYELQRDFYGPVISPEAEDKLLVRSRSQHDLAGWLFSGGFQYSKTLQQERAFLLQSARFTEVPYRLLDDRTDSWSGDEVHFSLHNLSPSYWQLLKTYATITYEVSSANRDSNPRPLYTYSAIDLEVGEVIAISKAVSVGFGGGYSRQRENNELGFYSTQDLVLIQQRGLSTFSRNVFQSLSRSQIKKDYSGTFFAKINNKYLKAFLEYKYIQSDYEARNGISFPTDAGKVNQWVHSFKAGGAVRLNPVLELQSDIQASLRTTKARDPIFKAINYESQLTSVAFSNVLRIQKDRESQWHFDVIYDRINREDFAGSDYLDYQFLNADLSHLFTIASHGKSQFYLKPNLGYFKSLKTTLWTGSTGLQNSMLQREYDFYDSSYFKSALMLEWLKNIKDQSFFVQVHFANNWQKDHNNYYQLNLNIGVLF